MREGRTYAAAVEHDIAGAQVVEAPEDGGCPGSDDCAQEGEELPGLFGQDGVING